MAVEMKQRADDPLDARKRRGAFFTPAPVADLLVEHALSENALRILEPSCGEAAFLLAAGRRLRHRGELHGIELHRDSADHAEHLLREEGLTGSVRTGDFFDVPGTGDYDLVIGNPPYVRFHDHAGEDRRKSREAAQAAGVEINELASSWAAFVAHSTAFLTMGGTLAMVLPAELLYTGYSAPVRELLLRRFTALRILIVEKNVFAGAQEQVLLVIGQGYGLGETPCVEFCVSDVTDTSDPVREPGEWRQFVPASPGARWSEILGHAGTRDLLGRAADCGLVSLEQWGSIRLGAVTGANKFFAITKAEAEELRLGDDEFLRISPPGSAHLRNLKFAESDWRELYDSGVSAILFRPGEDPSAGAQKKLEVGVAEQIDQRYKCRVRKPWWRTPVLEVPDLFLTYMNMGMPQLAANEARVHHINSVHGVYVEDSLRELAVELLPVAALNSATAVDAELGGRGYGGGMLKLEPGEARKWSVPSPAFIREVADALRAVKPRVETALQAGELDAAVDLVDEVALPQLGFSPAEAETVRGERVRLREKRSNRAKGGA